jgi:D-psicose/D-tagatose/L-ribulose 3-epimerase
MKFGINTYLWGAEFGPRVSQRLEALKNAGFDGIEVPILDPSTFPASSIRRELEGLELECTTVAIIPPGLGLGSSEAQVRSRGQEHVGACIARAAEVGAKLLSGPLYFPVGYLTGRRRTHDEWRWAVESWQQLGDTVSQYGIEIGIEPLNRFETYFLNTTADGAAFCEAVGHPAIGLLFDTFHANIEEKSLGEALKAAAAHLKHLHTCENDRGIPGSGHVAWSELFSVTAEIGYEGWMTIESFGFALGQLSSAAAIWRDLAPTPDAIAFEGLEFLRARVDAARRQASPSSPRRMGER